MIIKHIKIENFRAIKELNIEFDDQFTLIIGNNGVGKTTILDAIAIGLGNFTIGISGGKAPVIQKKDIRSSIRTDGDATFRKESGQTTRLGFHFVEYNTYYEFAEERAASSNRNKVIFSSKTEQRDLKNRLKYRFENPHEVLPVLNYQGFSRVWNSTRANRKSNTVGFQEREAGYLRSLFAESNTTMLQGWFKQMEFISAQDQRNINELAATKKTVADFMSIMLDSKISEVYFDAKQDEIMYRESKGKSFSLGQLSSGYQSIIWMVLEIAYRMAVLNPNLKGNISIDTPGIVLIDEIDLHLHPEWQWKIIGALKSVFPKVQFIATTHSPIILSSCKDKVIAVQLENQLVEYKGSSYGVPVDNVLSSFQDTKTAPKEVFTLVNEFHKALQSENLQQAEFKFSQLKELIGRENPIVTEAELDLEFEKIDISEEE